MNSRRNFAMVYLAVALSLALAACGTTRDGGATRAQAPYDLALANVKVIDVESGSVTPGQTILIRGDSIAAIVPAAEAGSAEQVINAGGAFALPGLFDMHIHLRNGRDGATDLTDENAVMLRQYLGYGVTAVRDAGGDLPEAVLRWRDAIDAGEMAGPRIFTSLQKIDGRDPAWPGSITVLDRADAVVALDRLTADGADFIKVYGRMRPQGYLAALEAAEARGLPTSAHMLFTLPFEATLEAGLDSIEHALYLHKAASPDDAELAAALLEAIEAGTRSEFGNPLARLHEGFNPDYARQSFRDAARRGVAVTPTLYIDHLLAFLDQIPHEGDALLANIPDRIVATYAERVEAAARRSPQRIAAAHQITNATIDLTAMAQEEGMTVLAGSDSGAVNSYVYPGDSLHQELRMLVESGLDPLDALQAATLNAARWLSVEDRYGALEAGKAADILLLSANPLADIDNTRAIFGLVQMGRYLPLEELEALRALCHPQDPPIADCEVVG